MWNKILFFCFTDIHSPSTPSFVSNVIKWQSSSNISMTLLVDHLPGPIKWILMNFIYRFHISFSFSGNLVWDFACWLGTNTTDFPRRTLLVRNVVADDGQLMIASLPLWPGPGLGDYDDWTPAHRWTILGRYYEGRELGYYVIIDMWQFISYFAIWPKIFQYLYIRHVLYLFVTWTKCKQKTTYEIIWKWLVDHLPEHMRWIISNFKYRFNRLVFFFYYM